ncbi:MAG: U32 family peptidase, partial [Lachnospiraceae bacterium]
MKKKIEVLAPAGSYESLVAAITAGADAVYVGGNKFGARAFANNLTQEQLLEAIDYVHLHGRHIYLTVNTLLKEEEITTQLYDYLEPLYLHGLDAVIVQD